MENKKKLGTGAVIALGLIAALNVLWLICNIIRFSGHMSFAIWVEIFEFGVATFYAVYGYKKPHGNHMRYLLLFYAVIAAVMLLIKTDQPTYISALYLVIIILVVYMAGRLDRFMQSIIICAAVLICNGIISAFMIGWLIGAARPLTIVNLGSCIGCVTVWLIIAASYIIRYKPHKEAGLADK